MAEVLRCRSWLGTIHFNSLEELIQVADVLKLEGPHDAPIRFICGQIESGERSHRPHYQVFVWINDPWSRNQVVGYFEGLGSWFAIQGNCSKIWEKIDYCRKDRGRIDGPWSWGSPPAQGSRSDLSRVAAMVQEGRSEGEIAETYCSAFIQYHNGVRKAIELRDKPAAVDKTVWVLWGRTGTGKSHRAHAKFPAAYWLEEWQWWDGYRGEEAVIIDDFDPSVVPFRQFLRRVDRYPGRNPRKGSYVARAYKHVVITTNEAPQDWVWKDVPTFAQQEAIERRLTHVIHVSSKEEELEDW